MDDVINKIPTQEIAEKRFTFIKNVTLRTNIVIAFRYMFFLLILNNDYKLPGPISYAIYKDIIIYTATIAESVLHYCLRTLIEGNQVKEDEILQYEWKEKWSKDLYEISDTEKVVGARKYKSQEKFSSSTQFQALNRAAIKATIFNNDLFDKAENLREKRNRIHLASLKKTDDYYGETDIKEAFKTTASIIKAVEGKLKSVNS